MKIFNTSNFIFSLSFGAFDGIDHSYTRKEPNLPEFNQYYNILIGKTVSDSNPLFGNKKTTFYILGSIRFGIIQKN